MSPFRIIGIIAATLLVGCANHHTLVKPQHSAQPVQQKSIKQPVIQYSGDTQVSGILIDENGADPVAGATVYIAKNSLEQDKHDQIKELSLLDPSTRFNTPANTCKKPSVPYVAFTCTRADGSFSLNISNLQSLPVQVTFTKAGKFSGIPLSLDDLGSDLGSITFMEPSWAMTNKVAIINHFDSTKVKSANNQAYYLDTELLDRYGVDTSYSLVEYPQFNDLLLDKDGDSVADINNYSAVLLKASWKNQLSQLSPEIKSVLLKYVEDGGQLFISEKAYSSENAEKTKIENYI